MAGDEGMTKSEQYTGKFNIGSSEEEIARRKGPVWQHTMPDIRMQQQQDDDQRQRIDDERRMRESGLRVSDPYFYLDSDFQGMLRDIHIITTSSILEGLPEERKNMITQEANKELPQHLENLMQTQLEEVEDILDEQLLRFFNPVPFETRQGEDWLKRLKKGIRRAKKESWTQSPEAQYILQKTLVDTMWVEGNFKALEGMGGGIDKFFDWSLILNWVRERYRKDPTASIYELTYAEKIRGVPLGNPEKAGVREEMRESLRARAVKYQDDCRFWSMAVAAVSQLEYDSNGRRTFIRTKDENGVERETLNEAEVEFIQLLFGDSNKDNWVEYQGHRFPKEILNWPVMSSIEVNKERYLSILSYLLENGTKDRLSDSSLGVVDSGGRANPQELIKLVEEVKAATEDRIDNWYAPDKSLNQRLADVVVKSGIVSDLGHRTPIHLGWGYVYKEVDGEIIRKQDSGGTTVATDITSGAWWRENESSNQSKGWTLGPLPDMSVEYRELLDQHSPFFKPQLKDLSKNAAVEFQPMHKALNRLWARLDSVNPELTAYLKDMLWFWETPYKTPDGRKLVLPMFFPPVAESINFWDALTDVEGGKTKQKFNKTKGKFEDGDPTIWDKYCAGVKPSEIDWKNTGDQAFYRSLITIAQTNRILSVMKKPSSEVGDQFEAFFTISDQLAELRKRVDLGVRDEKRPLAILIMSIAPLMIVVATAKKRGVISEKGYRPRERGKWVAGDLVEWRRKLKYTPEEREMVKGYREGMVALLDLYSTVFTSLTASVGKTELKRSREEGEELIAIIKEDSGVKIEAPPPETEPELTRPEL